MSRIRTTSVVAAFLLLGSCARVDSTEERGIALIETVNVSAVCANALTLLERGEQEKARAVLEAALAEAVVRARSLSRAGGRVDALVPNLAEGMRRARTYLSHRDPDLARAAGEVADELAAAK